MLDLDECCMIVIFLSPREMFSESNDPQIARGGEWSFENPGSLQIFVRSRKLAEAFVLSLGISFLHACIFLRLGLGFLCSSSRARIFKLAVSASLGFDHSLLWFGG